MTNLPNPEFGLLRIDGKSYRILVDPRNLRERDLVDFSPRSSLPAGGNIGYSELQLYQPIVQDDWSGGQGFAQHLNGSGYAYAEGSIETAVPGLLLLGTAPTLSDSGANCDQVDGGTLFDGKVYKWGPAGARRLSSGAWEDVYTAGGVNHMFANGKYLFLLPAGGAGTPATGAVTFASNPNNNDKTIIGRIIYTWKTALSAPQVANEILIGATAADSAANLKRTVNKEGTEGVTYGTGTAENPHAAASVASNVVTLTARRAGVWGNSLVLVTDGTRLTDAGLGSGAAGGQGDKAIGLITFVSKPNSGDDTVLAGVRYRWENNLTGSKGQVKIGSTAADCVENLRRAINDEGTEGTHYSTGTAAHPRLEAMADTQASPPTLRLIARAFGAGGNDITITVDGTRLTKTDMSGGSDGARVLKSETGASGSWSNVGVDSNPPCDMRLGIVHGGYHWFVEDGTAYVHYSAAEDCATLEGGGKEDKAVTQVGIGNVPVKVLAKFNNVLYAGSEDALSANDPANGFVWKPVLDFGPERHADNFSSLIEFRGYLYFDIRYQLLRWNGADAFETNPPPIIDTYPPVEYGRWRNLAKRGKFLYCSARTNQTPWVERVLKYNGSAWHPVAEAATNGVDTVTAVFNDPFNDRLWYHVVRADGEYTYYVQLQEYSELPYPAHPTSGDNRIYSSQMDMGFKWIKKSTRAVRAITKALPQQVLNTGPTFAGTLANVDFGGGQAWGSPGAAAAIDGSVDSVLLASGFYTDYLQATNLGYAIPAEAAITGVKVEVGVASYLASDPILVQTATVRLVKGGAVAGTDHTDDAPWPALGNPSVSAVTFGGENDLWGLSLAPSDINASDFGAAVAAINTTGFPIYAAIGHISVTVYYILENYFLVEYNPDNLGWLTLGYISVSPYQELTFGPTAEFYSVQFRLTPVTYSASVSPVLDAMVGKFLLRPDVTYGWGFVIVAAGGGGENEVLDERTSQEIVDDLKAARASKGPLEIEAPNGQTFMGYVSTVNNFARGYGEDGSGMGEIEWQVSLSVLEMY